MHMSLYNIIKFDKSTVNMDIAEELIHVGPRYIGLGGEMSHILQPHDICAQRGVIQ